MNSSLICLNLVHGYEILLKTPISTRMRFKSNKLLISFLYGKDEIIDILSNENLHNETSSHSKKCVCNTEYCKVKFYGTVLIDSRHSRRVWGNIWRYEIKYSYTKRSESWIDRSFIKDISLKKSNILFTKWLYLLYINTNYFPHFSDNTRNHLKETSWCRCEVEYCHTFLYKMKPFLNLEEFKCTSCTITESFCFLKIWISNDKLLCHNSSDTVILHLVKIDNWE